MDNLKIKKEIMGLPKFVSERKEDQLVVKVLEVLERMYGRTMMEKVKEYVWGMRNWLKFKVADFESDDELLFAMEEVGMSDGEWMSDDEWMSDKEGFFGWMDEVIRVLEMKKNDESMFFYKDQKEGITTYEAVEEVHEVKLYELIDRDENDGENGGDSQVMM